MLDITSCDKYVFLKLRYFINYLTPEVWMKMGQKQKHAFNTIDIEKNIVKHVFTFYALTECNTTRQFLGLGKISVAKIIYAYISRDNESLFCLVMFSV